MSQIESPYIEELLGTGSGALGFEDKVNLLGSLRNHSEEVACRLDRRLLGQIDEYRQGLNEAKSNQKKFKILLDQLSAPPWHPAVFLQALPTPQGQRAMVMHGRSRLVVGVSGEIDLGSLSAGDEVFLGGNPQVSVILAKSPNGLLRCGEIGIFDRMIPGGLLVIKSRDEEYICEASGVLKESKLEAGDLLRWDRNALLAYEKVAPTQGEAYFLEETPQVTFEQIGGLDRTVAKFQEFVDLLRSHPRITGKYDLHVPRGILLEGPPGVGKTMLVKALANYLAQASQSGRSRFINVKPGGLNSVWFGQTEQNWRELFRVARRAALQEAAIPVVIFLDEVDAVGAQRGETLMHVQDRVITSLMAELDGLESCGDNIIVVAATNRKDALDPALLRPERLGGEIITVPRPNRQASRDILAKHLPPEIPYARNGQPDSAMVREELIEQTVSTLFSANGRSELATITFRDGQRHTVRCPDLINGALLANIAKGAVRQACVREIHKGAEGLQLNDLLTVATREFESHARILTRTNCRNYVSGLPQDYDVVSVEPIVRKVRHPYTYLNLEADLAS